jgi:cytochrome c-type biogenesis protein CcmE
MNFKIIIAVVVIIGALIFGAMSFVESNVEYTDFARAESVAKKVQVKGAWVKEKESSFDAAKSQFTFYMIDDNQKEVKVVLDGAKPNNFDIATSIVAKGRYHDGAFHASEILTKCPSKYDGDSTAVKKSL